MLRAELLNSTFVKTAMIDIHPTLLYSDRGQDSHFIAVRGFLLHIDKFVFHQKTLLLDITPLLLLFINLQ